MLSMRRCAGLALSVAGLFAAVPGASATTYCVDDSGIPECVPAASPQQALALAHAHPGFDTVVLGAGTYDVGAGLSYSDDGASDNGLRIESRTRCPNRYTCLSPTLRGGAAGTAVLSLNAAGGSDVSAVGTQLNPMPDAIGLVLGPGARAQGVRSYGSETTGIRLDGTAAMPAVVSGGDASGREAVDATGYGILDNVFLFGAVGVRGHEGGYVDIRGGGIDAFTGVTAAAARITGTAITFADPDHPGTGSPVGVEAACQDAGSPDASIEIVNATIAARDRGSATGARAIGRGGDGTGCDAIVRMSSSIVHKTEVSLDARGEAGSGTDPRDGAARIEASYSDFSAAATTATGPAAIEMSAPGHNLDVDPGFAAPGWLSYPLLWSSSLIDAGDPTAPAEWQRPYIDVVNGRRDVGEYEYGFNRPELSPSLWPPVAATGTSVSLYAGAHDADYGEALERVWTLPDGSTSTEETLERTFSAPGRYVFRVRVTDPTGREAEGQVTARVVKQVITELRVRPARFRPSRRRLDLHAATIRFSARAADTIDFRVARATRQRGSRRIRWRRVPGGFHTLALASPYVPEETVAFNGWLKHRLRPGLYRLTARGRGIGKRARTRFRVIR
jgi:hypothetical protein